MIRGGSVGDGVGVIGVVLVEFAHAEVTDAAKIEIRKDASVAGIHGQAGRSYGSMPVRHDGSRARVRRPRRVGFGRVSHPPSASIRRTTSRTPPLDRLARARARLSRDRRLDGVSDPARNASRMWLLSALVLLPWLPIRVPAAFLIWAGPLRFWVLAMLAVAATSSALAQRAPPLLRALAIDPRQAPWLAGTIAACLYIAGAWAVSPHLPAGDEPHYLVITQSLLRDGDLKVENNYLRREYREFYAGDLQPHYLRRGQNQEIYSVHAPGLPAVVAPVFALFGYPGVIVIPVACERRRHGAHLDSRLAGHTRRRGELVRLVRGGTVGAVLLSGVHDVSRRARRRPVDGGDPRAHRRRGAIDRATSRMRRGARADALAAHAVRHPGVNGRRGARSFD